MSALEKYIANTSDMLQHAVANGMQRRTVNLKPASSPPMTWSMRPYDFASSGDMYLSRSVSSSSCMARKGNFSHLSSRHAQLQAGGITAECPWNNTNSSMIVSHLLEGLPSVVCHDLVQVVLVVHDLPRLNLDVHCLLE